MNIKPYIYNTIQSVKNRLEYRFNLVVGVINPFFQFFMLIALWRVLTANGRKVGNFTQEDAIWYAVWVFVISYFAFIGWIFEDIKNSVIKGEIVNTILKPVSHLWIHYTRYLGNSLITFTTLLCTTVILYLLRYGRLDMRLLAFMLSIVLTHMINFLGQYIIGILAFWTRQVHGFFFTYSFINTFFSGRMLPLSLMGHVVSSISIFLPAYALINTPIAILDANGTRVIALISLQILWIAIFYVIARIVFAKGIKNIEAVGL